MELHGQRKLVQYRKGHCVRNAAGMVRVEDMRGRCCKVDWDSPLLSRNGFGEWVLPMQLPVGFGAGDT